MKRLFLALLLCLLISATASAKSFSFEGAKTDYVIESNGQKIEDSYEFSVTEP